jgi:proline iminopeptidase
MIRQHFIAGACASVAGMTAQLTAAAAPRPSSAETFGAVGPRYATGRFPVAGGTLGYRRFGTAGTVHVLLSGGPGLESAYVDPVAVELSRDRTVVVLDQRGTGVSRDAYGDGSQLTVAGAVADLDGLRSELALRRLSLLGHSWGAMLSMAYAAAYGDRVSALALLDPGGPDPSFFQGFSQVLESHLTAADNAAAEAAIKGGQSPQRARLASYFHDRPQGLAYAAALPAHFSNPDVTRALFADIGKHYDVKAALRGTPIPALVLYGTDDPARSAEAQLDALFPHATKVMIADAGHFPWIENPAPFYAAIRAFLSTVPAPS